MITVTEAAKTELASFFEARDKSPVRIYLQSSCGGAMLRLALDEENPEEDKAFEVEGYRFLVEKDLAEIALPIQVDFTDYGFMVTSDTLAEHMPAGNCSGSCSSCEH